MPTRTPAPTLAEHLQPELFRAFCDPSRLEVLRRLAGACRPQTVTEIADCCGVHISGVSRHLAILRQAGVVHAVRAGRQVRYQLDCENVARTLRGLADALDACRAACCEV
jgi:DNA-binding transcriptional ArsR family regulator